ncbi:hypothetical protein ABPG75_002902 [Micractinium tetrahymenae]
MACRLTALLSLSLLAGLGAVAATLQDGSVRIKLVGRRTCRERGFLGPATCTAGSDAPLLKSAGGGPFSTFTLQAVPGTSTYTLRSVGRSGPPHQTCALYLAHNGPGCTDTSVFTATSAARWALVAVRGKPNTYRIRAALRATLCPWQYLGARKAAPPPVCFPAHATVSSADGRTVAMADLRTGDSVLSVDWQGRLTHEEVFYWSHWDPSTRGLFTAVTVQGAGVAGTARRNIQLGETHYLPVRRDASGACSALAAASAAGGNSSALPAATMAWSQAAQALSWDRHIMLMPPQLSPGMVAWSVETGAYTPVVRARGIVVDGVVASTQTEWNILYGRWMFPDPVIPTLAYYALTPLWWAYKLAGPELAWRVNRHPVIAQGPILVANMLVWGPLLLLAGLGIAAALAAARKARRSGCAAASRPSLFRAQTRRRSPAASLFGGIARR